MADTEIGSAPAREQRFQRRMSDAEALMWNVEKDPWLNPSGGSFSILDRMPDVEHLRAQLAVAIVTVPRLMEHVIGGARPLQPADVAPRPRVRPRPAPADQRPAGAGFDGAAARHGHAHLPGPLRPDPAAVDDARHRRAGGRPAAWLWKIHHSVADGTGAARLSELFIQSTRDAPALPAVDLEAAIAAAVEADAAEPQPSRRRIGRRDGDPPRSSPGRHRPPGGRRGRDVGCRSPARRRHRRWRGARRRPAPRSDHGRRRWNATQPMTPSPSCRAAHRSGATARGTATSR